MELILRGAVATMDANGRVLSKGAIYVKDGQIEAAQSVSKPPPAGYSGARQVDTGGVIYPGLIDLHSHMGYNALPLFTPPKAKYVDHDGWNRGDEYSTSVSWPSNVLLRAAPEASLKYAQVKALVGGTTAIQGKPKASRTIDGWLVRVIDDEQFGLPGDFVHTAVIPKTELGDLAREADRLKQPGAVYIPHVAEGIPGSNVHKEFVALQDAKCVQEGLIGIHGTALTASDLGEIGASSGAIVWSPFSNLWLYETTTDVATARRKGVRLCLGSDWSPSGTKHVLAELKVASIVNDALSAADRLDERELCELVTANPGDALAVAWGPRLGRIQPQAEADLVVIRKSTANVYENLIAARELDVQLVLIGGRAYYGTPSLMSKAGASGAESVKVAGESRKVVVQREDSNDARMTWAEVKADLERVRKDPTAAWDEANGELAAWGGSLSDPEAPLLLLGDMPDGDAEVAGALREPPVDLKIPKLDQLWHDQSFFDTTQARNGTLGQLRQWYS